MEQQRLPNRLKQGTNNTHDQDTEHQQLRVSYEKEEFRRSERNLLGRKFSLDCAPAALLNASEKRVEKTVISYDKTTAQPGFEDSERKKERNKIFKIRFKNKMISQCI